jgi:probable addiction module antidote protein
VTAKPYRSHEDATVESFAKDPEYAAEYLNAVLEDGDEAELLVALSRIAKAFGGVQAVAGHADLNATSLYRTLSQHGNPELKTLVRVLRVMNLSLAIRPTVRVAQAARSMFVVSVNQTAIERVAPPVIGADKLSVTQFVKATLKPKRRRAGQAAEIKQYSETAGVGTSYEERCYA